MRSRWRLRRFQVHRAVLPSGELVAVKVRRPGIETLIEADLAVLSNLAALADKHIADAALYNLPALVNEFARTIRRERVLAREGRFITRIAARFDGDATVRFPDLLAIDDAGCADDGVSGWREGVIGWNARTCSRPGPTHRRSARRRCGPQAVLVDGLFHADPHPGNILVLPGNVLAFIDLGIVGRVNGRMRRQLAEMVLAVGRHDAERLAEIVVTVAVPLKPIDEPALAGDLEEMLDWYADVPIGDLSLRDVFTFDHGYDVAPSAAAAVRSAPADQSRRNDRECGPPARSIVQDRRARTAARRTSGDRAASAAGRWPTGRQTPGMRH